MKASSGFSMVELLVAILILTIGLIGLAGLQSAGLRTNQGAYLRTVAVELAYDMADRMRANPLGVQEGLYNNGTESQTDCRHGACSAAELAGYDLAAWNAQVRTRLPNGSGMVCIVDGAQVALIGNSADPSAGCEGNGASEIYAIKIWWNDDRSGNTNQGFVMSFQP